MVVLSVPMTHSLIMQSFSLYSAISSKSNIAVCGRHVKGITRSNRPTIFCCVNGNWKQQETNLGRRRKVVEHLCLLKAKKDLAADKEKDMLDYLYSSQYQMRGIVAVSLGQLSCQTKEDYTHAVFMRFQSKEDLKKFYGNPFYLEILKQHVIPYSHKLLNVDYESEVEDDILPIFRKGEEFNYGVEFILLIAFVEAAINGPAEDALRSLQELTTEFQFLIVQCTQGSNFNISRQEYTHGVVIRFRSFEALEIFATSSGYREVWKSKFQPIASRTLAIHFSVDPVGTDEIM